MLNAEELQKFLAQMNFSDWRYVFSKNPAKLGISLETLTPFQEGYESKSPDGFVLGNQEILIGVGCPGLIAENAYKYYNEEAGKGGDLNENIDLFMSPSRISLMIGPNKEFEHLRILFNQVRFLDFVITYKIQGNLRVIPLWKMDHRFLYRVEKTRIIVGELFNDEIKVKIIYYVLKVKEHEDLPLFGIIPIVENITNETIEDIKLGLFLANLGHDWIISKNPHESRFNRFDFQISGKEASWSLNFGQNIKQDAINFINLEELGDIEEINEFFGQNSNKIQSKISESIISFPNQDSNQVKDLGMGLLNVNIGKLPSLSRFTMDFTIILSSNDQNSEDTLNKLISHGLYDSEKGLNHIMALNETFAEWMNWFEEVNIEVSDNKLFGLIDSILTLLRCIIGKNALHIGTLYYSHDLVFWRDNYWIQTALLKAGRYECVARDVDFFYKCWKNNGFRNAYNIPKMRGGFANSRELRTEIPMYSSLMVQNLTNWLGNDESGTSYIKKYYDLLKESLDAGIYSKNNLCVICSDETWIWPVYINEHDYYTDNSMISLSAYNFGTIASKHMQDNINGINWAKKKEDILQGITSNFILKDQFRFATGIDNNGLQDKSLLPTLISRPLLLNIDNILDPIVRNSIKISSKHAIFNGLYLIWDIMNPTGTIRSHTRTSAIEGNTIGNYLHACSDLDVPFLDDLLEMAINFSNSTGSVNEIHDLYNKKWGTEKQRSWDSSSLLEGIIHYLFGITPYNDYFECNPHLPKKSHSSKISNIRVRDNLIIVSCHKHGDDFEYSIYLKDIGSSIADTDFPIPEISIIKTNIPSRVRIYDSEILLNKEQKTANFFATSIQLFPRFIYTNTLNEDIPLIKLVNPITTKQDYWDVVIFKDHLQNLYANSTLNHDIYIVDLSAHKIRIQLTNFKNIKGDSGVEVKIENYNKSELHFSYAPDQKPIIIKPNAVKSIIIDFGSHSHDSEVAHLLSHLSGKAHSHTPTHTQTHTHTHSHKHNHEVSDEVKDDVLYPFKNLFEHIQPIKPYWKPHPLIMRLDEILFKNSLQGEDIAIICDSQSVMHAKEICTSIAIIKQIIIPIILCEKGIKETVKSYLSVEKNIILVTSMLWTELLSEFGCQKIVDLNDEHINQSLMIQNPGFANKYLFFIKNNGHVYRDTQHITNLFNIYLLPQRKKAISMYPNGMFPLSDIIGDVINEKLPIWIKWSGSSEGKNLIPKPNIYLQGELQATNNSNEFSGILDSELGNKSITKQMPYITIYSVNKSIPIELVAGGLAKGEHNIQFIIEANSDQEVEVEVELDIPQNFQPIWLRGKQRERTLDPTELLKNADGSKTLKITLHPGRSVHPYLIQKGVSPNLRYLEYIFGKYPRFIIKKLD